MVANRMVSIRAGGTFWSLTACLITLALIAPSVCLASVAYEKPGTVRAGKVLPPAMVSSPDFVVDDKVANDGFFNTYQCISPHGKFQAVGGTALEKLARELKAIDVMAQLETTSAFGNAVQAGIRKTGRGLESLVNDPVGTVTATAEQTVKKVAGLFSWAANKISPDRKESDPSSQAEDGKVEKLAGLTDAKRRVAARFGVDVYSANKVLQHHLERIGWAEVAGGMSFGKAMGQLPDVAQTAISASKGAQKLEEQITESSAGELRTKSRAALERMKLKAASINGFMANTFYSPREQAELVAALHVMSRARNRHLLLDAAATAHNRESAFLYTQMAKMYAGYNLNISQLVDIRPLARVVLARNAQGAVVVAVPVDYVIWSQKMVKVVAQVEGQAAKGKKPTGIELWITGLLSPACADQLAQRGWRVKTRAAGQLWPVKK